MKQTRNIIVKSSLTPDDFLRLRADANTARKSISSHIRDCCLPAPNLMPERRPSVRPKPVPFQAKFLPGRASRGFANMRH